MVVPRLDAPISAAWGPAAGAARAEAAGATEAVGARPCPVCGGRPRVLLVMQHPTMRRFAQELIEREFGCWVATEICTDDALIRTLDQVTPDLMILDAATFPNCCRAALTHIAHERIIVIGPEPDPSYRAVALAGGAGGWLPRDRVGEELASEMRRVLGCVHDPCPPSHRNGDPGSSRMHESELRPDAGEAPATQARPQDADETEEG